MSEKNLQDKEPQVQAQGQALVDELEEGAAQAEAETITPSGAEEAQRYQELLEQYTRLAADFDNYRKRMAQEIEQARRYGGEKAVLELLPVLDNLERAVGSLNENSDPKLLFQSFRLMSNQLNDGLAGIGVKRIEALGQPFDPNFHEAISQTESAEYPENTIAAVMQSGYMLNDRVLRPTLVSVSSGAPAAESAPASAPEKEEASANPFRHVGQ